MERLAHVLRHLGAPGASAAVAASAPAPTDPSADLSACWLDREAFLRGRCSEAERRQFAEQGWLLVEDALSPAAVETLTEVLDQVHDAKMAEAPDPSHPDAHMRMAMFTPANSLSNSEAVQRLLTCPAVFAKVVDILGWNIGVCAAPPPPPPPP
eukprot:COSAG04_NODE_1311_length_7269_cov_4.533333_6_plen_153_part_01